MRNVKHRTFLRYRRLRNEQQGVVVPLVAIGMLALLAVAGLALDTSHALANKTRMQNTVDAAALAAAKVLDQTDDTAEATVAAYSLLGLNAGGSGNHELNAAYGGGEITVTVQYSSSVAPFAPGSGPGPFVRVIATGFETDTTLSRVLGINEIRTPASAVAGPSGPLGSGPDSEVCDIAPIAVCRKDRPSPGEEPPPYVPGELLVLKPGPGNHGEIGSGNYKMLRVGCNGGSCLRRKMAGSYEGCATVDDTVDTEPGVSSGPTSQGFNTRFGEYKGGGMNPDDYPPDTVLDEQDPNYLKVCDDENPDDNHSPEQNMFLIPESGNNKKYCDKDYAEREPDLVTMSDDVIDYPGSGPARDLFNYYDYLSTGVDPNYRRVMTFPMVDCDGDQNGQSTLTVKGFACLFMLQKLETGQSDAGGRIVGEIIGECEASGTAGPNPGNNNSSLLYKIQLYKNSDSVDS